ncbi:MAG: pyridoxal phosphate-dependent aminotransferase [Bacteroidales bacterium]|jgi:aspartate/methionine/tyrosine aminotransferase|nr:pyridoxal phosphate-dependent aminotransferase [Bacteroidales bacterium]
MQTPIAHSVVQEILEKNGIQSVAHATIRQIAKVVRDIERATGEQFIKMEMGTPGLPASQIGIQAEIEALHKGVASIYPSIEGIGELKIEMARFVKSFLNVDISPASCLPTVGSMQGGFAAFLTACRRDASRPKMLFIDPGFPVQKQQMHILGLPYEQFDVYEFRGEKLRVKLEEYCITGEFSTLIYSSPNNPSWICFTQEELKIIGDIANKYDLIVIEDLAYFAMDFRENYGVPNQAPYQPTVAHYTDNYMLLISASKVFSYAGQRIAMLAVSNKLAQRTFPDLTRYFASAEFGKALIYGALYALSSGTAHSVQYAFAALLKAANDGTYNFVDDIKIYGERARRMKEIFTRNGFIIVYDTDIDRPVADGFYFTIAYPGMSGSELLGELLHYGISAITLDITGSTRSDGLRACTSQITDSQINLLDERLKLFYTNHTK